MVLVSVAGDAVAIAEKSVRTGVGGTTNRYASGLNLLFRRAADIAGSSSLKGALVTVGDIATLTLAATAAFTGGYNVTIAIQCAFGVIR